MAWVKGQSGNPKGPPRTKPWKDALTRALKRLDATQGFEPGTTLEMIAEKCVSEALTGDKDARREIAERFDGKAPQPIAGDNENPLEIIHRIERIIVSPTDTDGEGVLAATTPSEV